MPKVKEYRIVLPLAVDEYKVGQLYSVAEASKKETGGGEGIEVIKNEPFTDHETYGSGQYTYKIFHLETKVPRYIKAFAPKGSLKIHEEAWNAYPYCRTVVTNPDYMKDAFHVILETWHRDDRGDTDNVHKKPPETWSKTDVVFIDIADKAYIEKDDDKPEEDPTIFKSEKTGRGPLSDKDWSNTCTPVMCCYKNVDVKFKWWGVGGYVENLIHKIERRIFARFHRQVFCWIDKWFGMTMDDIRRLEDQAKVELDEMRYSDPLKGASAANMQ